MKKYLASIKMGDVVASIGYYADTPNKNYRIYYCGSDSGDRFEHLGNAANALEKLARRWAWMANDNIEIERNYTTRDEIPRHGSNA